jgi:hypothetical protein
LEFGQLRDFPDSPTANFAGCANTLTVEVVKSLLENPPVQVRPNVSSWLRVLKKFRGSEILNQ